MWRNEEKIRAWTIDNSSELYGIKNWGGDYFTIDSNGHVALTPLGKDNGPSISIYEIAKGVEERGLAMPVLLRIENILGSQIEKLHTSFRAAIEEFDYQGEFRGVFPIKVNQQEQVIEGITEYGRTFNHGLEAGSKPELIAAISMLNNRDAVIICNGYKDAEFIDLGLYATKMGFQCFFVVEIPNELDLILERARALGISPSIGVRMKLSTKAEGNWSESGGDNSVFGLNMSQLIDVVDRLKDEDMLDCLQLLHYHIGSQIPNIRDIRAGALEACRIYEELVNEGAHMGYLDLGGGLAVDYDGSATNHVSSRNYSMDEYCHDIVETITTALMGKDIQHPTIITESGRATVAYYSVLLFNILDVSSFTPHPLPQEMPDSPNDLLDNLLATFKGITPRNIQECYNDALFYRAQIRQFFKIGQLTLRQRAIAEDLFRHILINISQCSTQLKYVPEEIKEIDQMLSDIYYGNFSLFQSLPDVWAIDQLFPIMPIHRLDSPPTRPAIIADITCDCDGKIDRFPGLEENKKMIPLHPLKNKEEYYLGVFLVGAYQETLGDLHNLFGDTNVVSIHVNDDGTYEIVRELEGDSVEDVLSYVEYDINSIRKRIRTLAEDSIKNGLISIKERHAITRSFEEGLRGYTYFER